MPVQRIYNGIHRKASATWIIGAIRLKTPTTRHQKLTSVYGLPKWTFSLVIFLLVFFILELLQKRYLTSCLFNALRIKFPAPPKIPSYISMPLGVPFFAVYPLFFLLPVIISVFFPSPTYVTTFSRRKLHHTKKINPKESFPSGLPSQETFAFFAPTYVTTKNAKKDTTTKKNMIIILSFSNKGQQKAPESARLRANSEAIYQIAHKIEGKLRRDTIISLLQNQPAQQTSLCYHTLVSTPHTVVVGQGSSRADLRADPP